MNDATNQSMCDASTRGERTEGIGRIPARLEDKHLSGHSKSPMELENKQTDGSSWTPTGLRSEQSEGLSGLNTGSSPKAYQKYCNMAQVSCSLAGNISFSCRYIPIFCTSRGLSILTPSPDTEGDIPAFILRDARLQIIAIMADSIKPSSYLLSRNVRTKPIDVFMPHSNEVTDDNFTMLKWYIEKIKLSPYLSSATDPFPGHHFIVLGEFSDHPPLCDLSCLDLEPMINELQEYHTDNAHVSYQTGPQCDHFYYYLMLSKVQNVSDVNEHRSKKFELRINLVDKKALKKKALRNKKKRLTGKLPTDVSQSATKTCTMVEVAESECGDNVTVDYISA